jgi:hypothetical protein
MMTRTLTAAVAGRSSSMRRLRRRAGSAAAQRPYCRTNGCTTFLDVDEAAGRATCPVCGYVRRLD